jgi:hypothetical protein
MIYAAYSPDTIWYYYGYLPWLHEVVKPADEVCITSDLYLYPKCNHTTETKEGLHYAGPVGSKPVLAWPSQYDIYVDAHGVPDQLDIRFARLVVTDNMLTAYKAGLMDISTILLYNTPGDEYRAEDYSRLKAWNRSWVQAVHGDPTRAVEDYFQRITLTQESVGGDLDAAASLALDTGYLATCERLGLSAGDTLVFKGEHGTLVLGPECREYTPKPGLFQLAASLARSLPTIINNVEADDKVLRSRKDICNACNFSRPDRCLKCGCYLGLKQRLAYEACPIDKW